MESKTSALKKEYYIKILLTELICVGIIVLTVLVTKYFFKPQFSSLQKLWEKYATLQTKISEVLGDDK